MIPNLFCVYHSEWIDLVMFSSLKISSVTTPVSTVRDINDNLERKKPLAFSETRILLNCGEDQMHHLWDRYRIDGTPDIYGTDETRDRCRISRVCEEDETYFSL